jgi:hypothetical protein
VHDGYHNGYDVHCGEEEEEEEGGRLFDASSLHSTEMSSVKSMYVPHSPLAPTRSESPTVRMAPVEGRDSHRGEPYDVASRMRTSIDRPSATTRSHGSHGIGSARHRHHAGTGTGTGTAGGSGSRLHHSTGEFRGIAGTASSRLSDASAIFTAAHANQRDPSTASLFLRQQQQQQLQGNSRPSYQGGRESAAARVRDILWPSEGEDSV